MAETTATDQTEAPPKRKPGRPKGSRSKERAATVASIMSRGDPLARLAWIMKGRPVPGPIDPTTGRKTKIIPSPEMQLDAAKVLAKKVLPDLRTQEVTVEAAQESLASWLARVTSD